MERCLGREGLILGLELVYLGSGPAVTLHLGCAATYEASYQNQKFLLHGSKACFVVDGRFAADAKKGRAPIGARPGVDQ
jgi:hypothetical protein